MSAPNRLACITIRLERWAILLELRNISVENMERRSGNATSVLRNTPFSPIGKPTLRFAVLASTGAIAALCFPGLKNFLFSFLLVNFFLGRIRVCETWLDLFFFFFIFYFGSILKEG